MRLKNKSNCYVETLGLEVFERTPKTVFAAIAFSLSNITSGGDTMDDWSEARKRFFEEWEALYNNGIVSQKPIKSAPSKGD